MPEIAFPETTVERGQGSNLKAIIEEKLMPKELVVLLIFFLVASVVASGLKYETFGVPRPDEYFTEVEITIDQVTKESSSDDTVNRSQQSPLDPKDIKD
jgi:cytochrome b559 alpha subunit